MQTKDQRLNLRTSAVESETLRRAAAAEDKSVTEFILESALARAEMVLADQRWFVMSEEQFSAVERLLEEPVRFERLAATVASESPFGKEFRFDRG